MNYPDAAYLLFTSLPGLLCLYAAWLGWSHARAQWTKPRRAGTAVLGSLLMLGLSILVFATGLTEVVQRKGKLIPTLEWLWLVPDLLAPLLFIRLVLVNRERDDLEERLAAAAEHDPLTGLPNQAGFYSRALAALEAGRRTGRPAVVAALDIDHFKAINDGWGHIAGDEVLRALARAAGTVLRAEDVLGRMGGEEFALVLPGVDSAAALPLVERVREALRSGVAHPGGGERCVTVSAGIAPILGNDRPALVRAMQRADEALYAAKAAGRNRAIMAGGPGGGPI